MLWMRWTIRMLQMLWTSGYFRCWDALDLGIHHILGCSGPGMLGMLWIPGALHPPPGWAWLPAELCSLGQWGRTELLSLLLLQPEPGRRGRAGAAPSHARREEEDAALRVGRCLSPAEVRAGCVPVSVSVSVSVCPCAGTSQTFTCGSALHSKGCRNADSEEVGPGRARRA